MASTETETFIPDAVDATTRWEQFESALEAIPTEPDDDGFLSADIPVKSSSVNLRSLHPELHARLRLALQDRRIASIARVSSGVRTYEQQTYLYELYGPGRAANPDRVRSDGRRGSAHMVQPSTFSYAGMFEPGSYGYAVDVGFWGEQLWDLLRNVMSENGLRLTVFRPFEPWHFELDPRGKSAPASAFRFATTGSGITDMQRLLAEQHKALPKTIPDPGKPDGTIGQMTEAALEAWQGLIGVEADGSWGPKTEEASAAWLKRRTQVFRTGSSGSDVRKIERYLKRCHRKWSSEVPDPGDLDGDYGPATAAAAAGWQEKLGIEADGVWGPATWAASDRFDDSQRD